MSSTSIPPWRANRPCAGAGRGDRLRRAPGSGFDAPVTVDREFEFRQDTSELPVPAFIMIADRSRVQDFQALVPGVVEVLSGHLRRRIRPVRV